jgi:N-acetyl-anhydromuramyl-L-alanine amidase AmpD
MVLSRRTRLIGDWPMKLQELDINTDYPCDPGNYKKTDGRAVEWIVIHYTGSTGSGLANVRFFTKSLPAGEKRSAHFFVGHAAENARIYQSVAPGDIAWHCGTDGRYYSECRNETSIGIETCCHNDTKDLSAGSLDWYFDEETVDALAKLVRALMTEYDIDGDHILRHYDVTHKICPAMWVHDEDAWLAFKARLSNDSETEGSATERYKRLADIPNKYGFRDIVEKLMNAGIIQGDGSDPAGDNDVIDLSLDQVRMLVFLYRGGGFDKKLAAEGIKPAVGE